MTLKQTNKNKTKPEVTATVETQVDPECCGQGCNDHENKVCGITPVSVSKTCKLDNQIVVGTILILGGLFLILNAFVFPLL